MTERAYLAAGDGVVLFEGQGARRACLKAALAVGSPPGYWEAIERRLDEVRPHRATGKKHEPITWPRAPQVYP